MLVLALLAAPLTAPAMAQQVTTPAPATAPVTSGAPPAASRPVAAQVSARPALPGTSDRGARLSASQVEALRLVLDSESEGGRDRLARFVPWLATIGSVSPLIGLLGTVLGVISAFTGIAQKGSGNIAAVAPGVAEALVATAALPSPSTRNPPGSSGLIL